MRDDQKARLMQLSENVAEVFLEEADPNQWNGAGQPLATLDAETRGNRYWDKKNAIQTGSLLARILDLHDRDNNTSENSKLKDEDAEKEVKKYESKAKELIDAIQKNSAAKPATRS